MNLPDLQLTHQTVHSTIQTCTNNASQSTLTEVRNGCLERTAGNDTDCVCSAQAQNSPCCPRWGVRIRTEKHVCKQKRDGHGISGVRAGKAVLQAVRGDREPFDRRRVWAGHAEKVLQKKREHRMKP